MVAKSSDLEKIAQLVQFGKYKTTKVFQRYVRLPHKVKGLFTGNQSMKTSATAFQYVLRILGTHPVAKFNVLYFECERRAELFANVEDHDIYREFKERYLSDHKSIDSATYSKGKRPEDNICPECGSKIKIHKRKTRIFRFASETLPTEKGAIEGDSVQSAEVRNTQYPEFKKWCPPFLIKRDNITVRNSVLTLFDPNANMMFGDLKYIGADIMIEFSGYSQTVQAGAGVQRLGCWLDEEAPLDFYEEQFPRLLAEDGDLIITVTPASGLCFDEETEIITKRGWKFYDEILMDDILLTYNIENDCLEWKDIIGFYLEKVENQKMFYMKNSTFDAYVTPEHRWVVCNTRRQNDKYLAKTNSLNSKHIIKRLTSKTNIGKDCVLHNDEVIALVGWVVTDGTVTGSHVTIYQSETANLKHCNALDKISEKYGDMIKIKGYEYNKENSYGGNGIMKRWMISGSLRIDILKRLTKNKGIKEEFICSLSKRQLEILFNAMVDGDGHRNPNGSIVFTQVHNEELVENFLLICTLLGRLAKKHKQKYFRKPYHRHTVYVYAGGKRYMPNTHHKSLNIEEKMYNGFIWCPSTENKTVVVKRNGCVSISGNSWSYDDIFEKAKIIVRTPTICKYYLEEEGRVVKEIEHTDSEHDIAVIQAATDDNPTLSPDVVEAMYREMPDLDGTAIATRRFGIFKQATGRIFKDMNYNVHVIDPRVYGIGPEYINGMVLARTFDFHPANPHAIIWAGLSPSDELFVYREWAPSPDKWVISRLVRHMAKESGHEKYVCNLIDPLANTANQESGKSTVELMNNEFLDLKRAGIGTGGYWESFNTKGEVGRDAIKERLYNSLKVEKPFNNKVTEDGKTKQLPTIWIFKECRETARSLKQWRLESWASNRQLATRDRKEKHAEKWSHFCTALEGLLKDKRFRPRRDSLRPQQRGYTKFQGGRR